MGIPGFLLRERFHLLVVHRLAERLESRPWAVKGGIGLRFFHRSPRLSEDLDCDVGAQVRPETLRRGVEAILADGRLAADLAAMGVAAVRATAAKQTATLQRWKVALRIAGGGVCGFPTGGAGELVHHWGWGLSGDGWALVPHRDATGTLTGVRLRHPSLIRPSGGSRMVCVPGSRFRQLYGVWIIDRGAPSPIVLLCEGETDAIQASRDVRGYAIRVLGVPGAGTAPTALMLEPFAGRDTFVLFDEDDVSIPAGDRWCEALLSVTPSVWRCRAPFGEDLRSSGLNVLRLLGDARPAS